jgi:hypothetical protein
VIVKSQKTTAVVEGAKAKAKPAAAVAVNGKRKIEEVSNTPPKTAAATKSPPPKALTPKKPDVKPVAVMSLSRVKAQNVPKLVAKKKEEDESKKPVSKKKVEEPKKKAVEEETDEPSKKKASPKKKAEKEEDDTEEKAKPKKKAAPKKKASEDTMEEDVAEEENNEPSKKKAPPKKKAAPKKKASEDSMEEEDPDEEAPLIKIGPVDEEEETEDDEDGESKMKWTDTGDRVVKRTLLAFMQHFQPWKKSVLLQPNGKKIYDSTVDRLNRIHVLQTYNVLPQGHPIDLKTKPVWKDAKQDAEKLYPLKTPICLAMSFTTDTYVKDQESVLKESSLALEDQLEEEIEHAFAMNIVPDNPDVAYFVYVFKNEIAPSLKWGIVLLYQFGKITDFINIEKYPKKTVVPPKNHIFPQGQIILMCPYEIEPDFEEATEEMKLVKLDGPTQWHVPILETHLNEKITHIFQGYYLGRKRKIGSTESSEKNQSNGDAAEEEEEEEDEKEEDALGTVVQVNYTEPKQWKDPDTGLTTWARIRTQVEGYLEVLAVKEMVTPSEVLVCFGGKTGDSLTFHGCLLRHAMVQCFNRVFQKHADLFPNHVYSLAFLNEFATETDQKEALPLADIKDNKIVIRTTPVTFPIEDYKEDAEDRVEYNELVFEDGVKRGRWPIVPEGLRGVTDKKILAWVKTLDQKEMKIPIQDFRDAVHQELIVQEKNVPWKFLTRCTNTSKRWWTLVDPDEKKAKWMEPKPMKRQKLAEKEAEDEKSVASADAEEEAEEEEEEEVVVPSENGVEETNVDSAPEESVAEEATQVPDENAMEQV